MDQLEISKNFLRKQGVPDSVLDKYKTLYELLDWLNIELEKEEKEKQNEK